MFGKHHSEESKLKMSLAQKGKKVSPETKAKISAAGKLRVVSQETRVKLSAASKGESNPMFGRTGEKNPLFGKPLSPETKAKMSLAKKGKKAANFGCGKKFEFNGESHSLSEWALLYGLPIAVVGNRVRSHHWSLERALTTPARKISRAKNKNPI